MQLVPKTPLRHLLGPSKLDGDFIIHTCREQKLIEKRRLLLVPLESIVIPFHHDSIFTGDEERILGTDRGHLGVVHCIGDSGLGCSH